MKLLIISRGIPTKENPLNGIFEMDQARALSKAGHEVTLFVLDLRSIRRRRGFGRFEKMIDGIRVYIGSYPIGAVSPGLMVKCGSRILLKMYKKVYSGEQKPDIIHAHFTEYGGMAARLSEKTGIPLVITEHSSIMAGQEVSKKLLQTAEKAYTSADCLISVSRLLADNILRLTGVRSEVVHNIIDGNVFCRKDRTGHDGFRFISVSNLNPRKRIDLLIRAFSLIKDKCPEAVLDVVGEGEERQKLEKLAASLRLGERVTFTGRLTRREIADCFSRADCFVLPSERETFGVVYAEAMMAGLPVIATICGGPEEFVPEAAGKVGHYDSPDTLADVMEEMYHTAAEYRPAEIREYAVTHFSPEIISERLTEIYRSVLDERNGEKGGE